MVLPRQLAGDRHRAGVEEGVTERILHAVLRVNWKADPAVPRVVLPPKTISLENPKELAQQPKSHIPFEKWAALFVSGY